VKKAARKAAPKAAKKKAAGKKAAAKKAARPKRAHNLVPVEKRPPADPAIVRKRLKQAYPGAHCALEFTDAFTLLVMTILAAQSTDVNVNRIAPSLWKRWPDAKAMAEAELPELEVAIHSTGFFRQKSKSLSAMSKDLVAKFSGVPPKTMEELLTLRGVGRKTANVVLGNAYGVEAGVVVDTHVGRLSRRLGLSKQGDPVKVEQDLMKKVPPEEWTLFSHLLIDHGRTICHAKKPLCSRCELLDVCPRIGVKVSA
jgi:endonuclease-3